MKWLDNLFAGRLSASRPQRNRRADVHAADHVQHHQEAQKRPRQVQ
jgi:hypothetical protein